MPPKASKKRPAAPDDESNRFVKRIAQHLREASDVAKKRGDDFGWDEARIGQAFDDAVTHMPPGAVRDHLRAHLDVLRTLAVEMFFRPEPTDFPGLGEPGGPDDRDFHERKKPYRDDFGNMSLAELVEETDRCLLKARCEIPVQFVGDATECLNWEKGKEGRLERCVDAAWATCERWRDESKTPDGSGKTPEAIGELSELMERIATHCAARVRLGTGAEPGADPELRRCVTEKTHECAAKVVLIRHKFRRATPKEKRPKENGFWTRTACHDAAQLCGDTRWRLVYQLAMEIPEDVGVEPADVETGASGEGKRKKSRRNVVGRFGCNDQALFDAALGLSGFDEEFEAKVGVDPALFARTNTFVFTHPICYAPLPPSRAVVSARAWFFQGARRTLDFFRTPPRNTVEPSPSKHWQVVNKDVFCRCAWGLHSPHPSLLGRRLRFLKLETFSFPCSRVLISPPIRSPNRRSVRLRVSQPSRTSTPRA